MADNTPQPQGITYIPISLIGDTNPVTQATTVNFTASLPDASEPTLTLSFYEVNSMSSNTPLTVANPPVPVWSNGVATFALVMDSDIFDQLSSATTNFAVAANGPGSFGSCTFAIALQTDPPTGGGNS